MVEKLTRVVVDGEPSGEYVLADDHERLLSIATHNADKAYSRGYYAGSKEVLQLSSANQTLARKLEDAEADARRWRRAKTTACKDGGDICLIIKNGYDNFGLSSEDIDAAIDELGWVGCG